MQIQEETSADTELWHTTEVIGYLAFTTGQITKPSGSPKVEEIDSATNANFGTEENQEVVESTLSSTEIIIGGNMPLNDEQYQQLGATIDLLALNEGSFVMTVTALSGTYTFYLSPGKIFDYFIMNQGEFTVTYNNSKEIIDLLNILFEDDPISKVSFP